MTFRALPAAAAWLHRDARIGFEAAFFERAGSDLLIAGHTTAVEGGMIWCVEYEIRLDPHWSTRSATVRSRTASSARSTLLQTKGDGRWDVDGRPAPHLDGCRDVDLESSAFTNALPVHRMAFARGQQADTPAAYVRARDGAVERLEQSYARIDDDDERQRFDYAAPAFGFTCELQYDDAGLLLDYPGIAVRAG